MFKNKKLTCDTNLLDCRPVREVEYTENSAGQVVLLRPRFMSGPLARWIQPRLKAPNVKVALDPIGSFVWQRCDGERSVGEILEEMKATLTEGESDAPLENPTGRLRLFLQQLVQGGMLRLEPPAGSPR